MNPIAFTIFGNEVRWYGILIAAGMILAVLISYKRAPKFGIDRERLIDLAIFCLPAGVIGARLWYVLFNWEFYRGDFMKIINIKQGGLAFHGGLILAVLVAVLLCRKWSVSVWDLTDLTIPVIALAQSIRRWGNYINQEAYGRVTDLPWAIEVNGQMVHPTFLYESVWCFLMFLFLMKLSPNRKFAGQITLLYGILYSVERFFVESLRTDSLYFMGFRTAQLVSIAIFVGCLAVYFVKKRKL